MKVEWDESKNRANQQKHDVSFDEARELFTSSTDYLEIVDLDHSETEDRFISIGPITRGLVLVVWTECDEDTIRLISARWATQREQTLYHQYMDERS